MSTPASSSASMPASDSPSADGTSTAPTRAWGLGLATLDADGNTLDAWYPAPELGAAPADATDSALATQLRNAAHDDSVRDTHQELVLRDLDLTVPPADTADAYLRLHLLSHRLVQPNVQNLDGIFGALTNVVWTSEGPCAVTGFEQTRLSLIAAGRRPTVFGIDKFPRMVDYVLPSGVRIGDADRVRLGAHLSDGTTVMHEGFVNYNAGTLGTSMVEGRISQGVVIGDGSDIGGGASTMGTLSGGGTERVSVGRRSLVGAEAGIGIALGDDCVVESGLYLTAGTKVKIAGSPDESQNGTVLKARELSGAPNLLFLRNSQSGAVEARPRAGRTVELNAALHAN